MDKLRDGGHHGERDRPGHGEGLRRRTAQGHRQTGQRPHLLHRQAGGTAAPVRPGHLRGGAEHLHGRADPVQDDGWAWRP